MKRHQDIFIFDVANSHSKPSLDIRFWGTVLTSNSCILFYLLRYLQSAMWKADKNLIYKCLRENRWLGEILSEWIFYYLKIFDLKTLAHATTLPSLQLSKIHEIPIPLPPLSEQHRTVAKIEELFTKLDAGVEALKKIKGQIKRYRQAVLKYAFRLIFDSCWSFEKFSFNRINMLE